MSENFKKMLIIKFSAIGDVLMATPAFRSLRIKYPKAKIYLLIGDWSKEAVIGNPNIDELITFDDKIFRKHKIIPTIRLIQALRKERFDLVINTHRSKALNIFAFLVGGRESLGFSRNFGNLLLSKTIYEDKNMHEIDKYLMLVGVSDEKDKSIDIFPSQEDERFAEKIFNDNDISEGDIVIGMGPGGAKNPGEDMPQRRWLPEYYAELSDILIGKGAKVIFLGNKLDRRITEFIKAKMKNRPVDISGSTSLKQAAAVIKRCRAFVTHDCGLLHIAAAAKVPIVTIFGPTGPKEKVPIGAECLYAGVDCSPCYLNGKFPDCKDLKCMSKIVPQNVIEILEEKKII